MKKLLVLGVLVVAVCLVALVAPASAAGTLYVDDDDVTCGGNSPCYAHPQDAVNAANPGDTILVYPGTYDSRYFLCPWAPGCSDSDNWAPALIVYKDGLTIKSVDGPSNTIIQSTHNFWSNAIAVENSTAGGITGISGWAPNAITIVADNVTIDGFTLHRHYEGTSATWNTAGVFIGSKGAGYPDFLGDANGATVKNNVFSDVWHAVYIWHSSGNQITDNTIAALGNTGHWAAISIFDGDSDAQIGYGNLSTNNVIARNTLADKGISVGAWQPTVPTDNSGTQIVGNTVQGNIGFYYTSSSGMEIRDNVLPGAGAGQIIFDGGPSSFTSCVVSGNTVGAGTGNGIQLFYMTDGSVSDNDVSTRTANGIALLDSTGVSITGNASTDNGASGIVLVRTADVLVSGNQILRNAGNVNNPGGLTIREGVGSTTVVDNTIGNNTQYGVWIRDTAGTGNMFHCNRIVANGVGMLNNTASLVDAEDNWWGSATGPTHASNPGGTGDSVSDNVDFDPWLTTEFCAAPTPTPTPPPGVGGTIELHDGASSPSAQRSDSAAFPYAALALAAAAAAIAIAASAWYARRRWIR
jgi:parallel beta-helix repeat protein